MAELEELLEKLPNLVENLKLNVVDVNELSQEITRLHNTQKQLQKIKEEIEGELDLQKFQNTAIRALPFLSTVATIFIPGGFFVDTVIAGSAGFFADKFVNPEAEITLQDLQSKVEEWIKWCDYLQERAEEILNNTQLLSHIKSELLKPSVNEQVHNIDNYFQNNLDFGNYHIFKQQFETITNAQYQLTELQEQLNQIIYTIEQHESIIDILFGISSFFGNRGFNLEWLNDEHGLILSSKDEFKSVADILDECKSLKEKSLYLILQANTLRGEAEQNLKNLQQENFGKEFTGSDSSTSQINNPTVVYKLKPIIFIVVSSLIVFLFGTGIGKEKFSPIQQMNLNSNNKQDAVADLQSAKKIAMSAAIMVQNPPHSQEVWQKAKIKWQQSINLLESIPEGTLVSTEVKNKLAIYRVNYKMINQRIMTEKKAAINWKNSQKIAMSAAIMVQNPPHPPEVWQKAKFKWQQSINLLESIPEGTFYSQQAKHKLSTYKNNYVTITKRLK
ncbi:MAG: hypothetical protein QNJ36_10920 [Calothrix sp. MO_167.B42]|nr:hypothetical protein [Calothrix sp. MO_167.B42]